MKNYIIIWIGVAVLSCIEGRNFFNSKEIQRQGPASNRYNEKDKPVSDALITIGSALIAGFKEPISDDDYSDEEIAPLSILLDPKVILSALSIPNCTDKIVTTEAPTPTTASTLMSMPDTDDTRSNNYPLSKAFLKILSIEDPVEEENDTSEETDSTVKEKTKPSVKPSVKPSNKPTNKPANKPANNKNNQVIVKKTFDHSRQKPNFKPQEQNQQRIRDQEKLMDEIKRIKDYVGYPNVEESDEEVNVNNKLDEYVSLNKVTSLHPTNILVPASTSSVPQLSRSQQREVNDQLEQLERLLPFSSKPIIILRTSREEFQSRRPQPSAFSSSFAV